MLNDLSFFAVGRYAVIIRRACLRRHVGRQRLRPPLRYAHRVSLHSSRYGRGLHHHSMRSTLRAVFTATLLTWFTPPPIAAKLAANVAVLCFVPRAAARCAACE